MTRWATAGLAGLWLALAGSTTLPAQSGYDWKLPPGVRTPHVPADNPMSEALVELGGHLFYDTRLSANRTQSCATCHEQARAFTDGKARSVGSTGQVIDHYADGGRTIADGPHRGVGHDNPNKSAGVRGFWLTTGQRADLLAFLESLTDGALLHDPRFADPWPAVVRP